MAKNTSSSEITPRSSRKTETFSNQTLSENKPLVIPWHSVQEYFEATSERIRELENVIPEFKNKRDTAFKRFRSQTQKELLGLRSRSDRTIETIGIFAALLSFVTFEAQIFKSDLNGFTLVGLSSLLLGALLLFVFALGEAFNPTRQDDIKQYLKRPLLIFSIILVIVGVVMAWVGYSKDSQEQESIQLINNEFDELKIEYDRNDFEIEKRINGLESRINQLSAEGQSIKLDDFKKCIGAQGLVRCL